MVSGDLGDGLGRHLDVRTLDGGVHGLPATQQGVAAESDDDEHQLDPCSACAAPVEEPQDEGDQERLRGVHAVLGLVEDDGLRPVDDVGGDLLAAVGGQAVHEHGVGEASAITAALTWYGCEGLGAGRLLVVAVAHREPDVGVDGVGVRPPRAAGRGS